MDQMLRLRLAEASARKARIDGDPAVRRREAAATDQVLAEAWINRQAAASITEAALRARYQRDIAGKPGPEEVRAQVILVPTEAEARALIARIEQGADFGDLARQFSKDLSAAPGGQWRYGYVSLDALSAEVGAVLFAPRPTSQVDGDSRCALLRPGYFVLRVAGRRQRATPGIRRSHRSVQLANRAAATASGGVRCGVLTADIRVQNATGNTGGGAIWQSRPNRPVR